MIKKNAYFLVGPTASGKSHIAHLLAKKLSTSIISADSMNIYSGMDIGTAKPSSSMQVEINYTGLNIINPSENFNVFRWLELLKNSWSNLSDTPIVCGGTGLYVKCLIDGMESKQGQDQENREKLELLDLEQLQDMAKNKINNEYLNLSSDDKKNKRRIIRLFERGNVGDSWELKSSPPIIGLYLERKKLHENIEKRVLEMFNNGLLDEAKELLNCNLSQTAQQAIGYQEVFDMQSGKISKDEALEKTIIRTRQLAKRQMTWFKNKMNIKWVDIDQFKNKIDIVNVIYNEWMKNGPTNINI